MADFICGLQDSFAMGNRARQLSFLKELSHSIHQIDLDEIQLKALDPVISQVPQFFQDVLDEIGNIGSFHAACSSDVTRHVEEACTMMDAITSYIAIFRGNERLELMYSLPANAMLVLKKSYLYVQTYTKNYSSSLKEKPASYVLFTTKIQALQKVLRMLLSKITAHSKTKECMDALQSTCSEILDFIHLVKGDAKFSIGMWCIFTRLAVDYYDHLETQLFDLAIKLLCSCICDNIENLKLFIEKSDNQDVFASKVGTCSEYLLSLTALCAKHTLSDSSKHIFNVILELLDVTLLHNSRDAAVVEEREYVQNCLSDHTSSLIKSIINEESFYLIMQSSLEDDMSHLSAAFCILKLLILENFPATPNDCTVSVHGDERTCIFQTIFCVMGKCSARLVFSYMLTPEESEGTRLVTLYEFLLLGLSCFLSSHCSCHFFDLERCMFYSLFNSSDIGACLVSDIWCFLLRIGPVDLCYDHFCVLARGMVMQKSELKIRAACLLQRFIKYLNPAQQDKLKYEFPFLKQINEDIVKSCETPNKIFRVSFFLHEVSTDMTMENKGCMEHFLEIKKLQLKYQNHRVAEKMLLVKLIVCLLKIAQCLVPEVNERQLLKFLQFAAFMWKTENYFIQMAVLQFLTPWVTIIIPSSPSRENLIENLADLLATTLRHPSEFLQQEALFIFTELAYYTPNEKVIMLCMKKVTEHKMLLSNFIRKIPLFTPSDEELMNVSQSQGKAMEVNRNLTENFKAFSISSQFKNELTKKIQDISELRTSLSSLEVAAEKIKALRPLPVWAHAQVETVCANLLDITS